MGTELEFALKSCQTAIDSWMPTPENKLIINLPATVEISTPNAFATMLSGCGAHCLRGIA